MTEVTPPPGRIGSPGFRFLVVLPFSYSDMSIDIRLGSIDITLANEYDILNLGNRFSCHVVARITISATGKKGKYDELNYFGSSLLRPSDYLGRPMSYMHH